MPDEKQITNSFSHADNSREPRLPACSMSNGYRMDDYLAGKHGCARAAENEWGMERLPHREQGPRLVVGNY